METRVLTRSPNISGRPAGSTIPRGTVQFTYRQRDGPWMIVVINSSKVAGTSSLTPVPTSARSHWAVLTRFSGSAQPNHQRTWMRVYAGSLGPSDGLEASLK